MDRTARYVHGHSRRVEHHAGEDDAHRFFNLNAAKRITTGNRSNTK
jgi:hypothetical protein